MIYFLVYISTASNPADFEMLSSVISQVAIKNKEQGISGFLYYKNGTYLQLLEGDFKMVNTLFHKIIEDERHKNVTVIIENKIEQRIFNDYESGFLVPKNEKQNQKLNDYLNYLKLLENDEINRTISILESIISKM